MRRTGGSVVLLPAALGLLPFLSGGVLNAWMAAHPAALPPFFLIGAAALALWFLLSLAAYRFIRGMGRVVIPLHLPALAVLALLGVQAVRGSYWMNAVGVWTQLFYLPLIHIGGLATSWSGAVFPTYCAAFLMMAAASCLGYKVGEKVLYSSAGR